MRNKKSNNSGNKMAYRKKKNREKKSTDFEVHCKSKIRLAEISYWQNKCMQIA